MARRRWWSRQPRTAIAAPRPGVRRDERGYLMVALLVAMSVMAIMMGMALPAWRTLAQREKEAELIFRGEQYARAIALFQRRYANATPPDIDVLVRERFLRKKYKDPITNDDFQVITPASNLANVFAPAPGAPTQGGLQGRGAAPATGGQQTQAGRGQVGGVGGGNVAGVIGVVSKSTDQSFRLYNGRDTYNQWLFVPIQQSNRAGGPGGNPPGVPPGGAGPRGAGPRGGTGLGPGGQRGGQGAGPRGGGGRGAQPQNPARGGRGF